MESMLEKLKLEPDVASEEEKKEEQPGSGSSNEEPMNCESAAASAAIIVASEKKKPGSCTTRTFSSRCGDCYAQIFDEKAVGPNFCTTLDAATTGRRRRLVKHLTCACPLAAPVPEALTRKEKAQYQVYWFLQRRCCTFAFALACFDRKQLFYAAGDGEKERIVAIIEKALAPPCEGCTVPGRPRSDCNASCCPITLEEPSGGQGWIMTITMKALAPPCDDGCTEPGRPRSGFNVSCRPITLVKERPPGQGCIKALAGLFFLPDRYTRLSLAQCNVLEAFAAGTF